MIIKPLFELNSRVLIKELNVTGKVLSYYYKHYIEYNIRYFDDGNVRECYFLEDELTGV